MLSVAKTVTAAAWSVKMFIFAIPTFRTMFVPKRDSLGFVSINDFYDYIRCIFDDINKSVINKRYSDYALQINPETLEFTINPIDEIMMTDDTYPLKDLIRPSSFAGGVSGNYEAVEQVVSKYLSYC